MRIAGKSSLKLCFVWALLVFLCPEVWCLNLLRNWMTLHISFRPAQQVLTMLALKSGIQRGVSGCLLPSKENFHQFKIWTTCFWLAALFFLEMIFSTQSCASAWGSRRWTKWVDRRWRSVHLRVFLQFLFMCASEQTVRILTLPAHILLSSKPVGMCRTASCLMGKEVLCFVHMGNKSLVQILLKNTSLIYTSYGNMFF